MAAVDFSAHVVNPLAAGSSPAAATAAAAAAAAPSTSSGGPTFDDLLDVVNPLHHFPVVGTLYRAITDDQIKPFTKVAGDFLYGGPMGFASSMADLIFEKITGHNVGDTVLAAVEDVFSSDAPAQPTGVADNEDTSLGGRLVAFVDNLFTSAPDAPTTAIASATPPASVPDSVAVTPMVAYAAPIDTTATAVASNAPALAAPANVTPASLDTIVIPGQDALLLALTRNGVNNDMAIRAADAYRRTLGVAADAALRGSTN